MIASLLILTILAGPMMPASISLFGPGDVVPEAVIESQGAEAFFTIQEISDELFEYIYGKSYKEDCTLPRSELRYLTVLHRNAEGQAIVGEMMVNRSIADDILEILRELYDNSYPIERMLLIDRYNASDEASMNDNNSSAFNFRMIAHTAKPSKHGLGMAVDINPLYNPYHKIYPSGKEVIEPESGTAYLDRSKKFTYKIERGDLCWRLFIAHGFKWGGGWTSSKDYQHFEK